MAGVEEGIDASGKRVTRRDDPLGRDVDDARADLLHDAHGRAVPGERILSVRGQRRESDRQGCEQGIDAHNYSSGNITEAFEVKKLPHQHNALNDCRSIVQGLILLKKKSINPN